MRQRGVVSDNASRIQDKDQLEEEQEKQQTTKMTTPTNIVF
jgi:hypothetical protein